MSLYHETAEVLEAPASAGGNLKSRIFKNKKLKSAPAQVYALAIETCKWSPVLKEVIENSKLLRLEKKVRNEMNKVPCVGGQSSFSDNTRDRILQSY